jgi:hypothetical protein
MRPSTRPSPELTVALLDGARSVIQRGWVRDAWYVLEAPDGRRRLVTPGSLTSRRFGIVVAACLVGAVVEAGRRYSDERGISGPAIDALWHALQESEQVAPYAAGWEPPLLRTLQVRDLACWNDAPGRTREDVLRLIDVAAHRAVHPAGVVTSPAG